MTDLRKALEHPDLTKVGEVGVWGDSQEPIGWGSFFFSDDCKDTEPPKREWVGLTEVDIYEAMDFDDEFEFAKAIEAKLKEKNT